MPEKKCPLSIADISRNFEAEKLDTATKDSEYNRMLKEAQQTSN
jgi:hypothetical protein